MDIMESSGYRDFVWAVELHRLGLEVIGLWPKTEQFTKKCLWPEIRVGIVLILLIFIFIPMISMVIHVWGNMVLVIDSLHFTLPLVTVLAKYVIMRWKRTGTCKII
ncbi:uncharacterized protein LOC112456831 isoform X1 [Temnothorax curvispinosus]|uniref:Uncharacterized protein LOC112456831 isoform X1 n=1 Tax=Temnothorax curvispinosus TaxID=300111 RepID=A0A6J1Q1K1_9HYME|nr:uncharacterized protein LOC112456831 isoform X1 [Temnothorax curvispinosus]